MFLVCSFVRYRCIDYTVHSLILISLRSFHHVYFYSSSHSRRFCECSHCFLEQGHVLQSKPLLPSSHHSILTLQGGNDSSVDNANTNLAVNPLYDLPKSKWWMQADRGCDAVPPPKGEFLELPAGKSFMTELANNRAFTTLSYKGELTTEWQDGKNRSMPWRGPEGGCLMDGGDGSGGELHTKNIESTGGTAWAISYESDISKVTMDNLVVFSVRY